MVRAAFVPSRLRLARGHDEARGRIDLGTNCPGILMPDGLQPIDPPRELSADERAVLEQLILEPSFNGRDEIQRQLSAARVVAEGQGDHRTLLFDTANPDLPRVPTAVRIPVEGEFVDDDGVPIAVLLHVVGGVVEELEIYRVDGQEIRREELGPLTTVSINEDRVSGDPS